jgi:Ca-activated chloride channel family protein
MRILPDVFQRAGEQWRGARWRTAAILPPRTAHFVLVLGMSLGLKVIAAAAWGQFASGVSLVEVYATVLDEQGAAVGGLSADDFTVAENGRGQQIQAFAAGNFPLSLAVAVDRSFSMPRQRLTEVVNATQRLLGELGDQDGVMLLAIGSEVEVLTPLSKDHRLAYDALRDLQPWGTTPLFDATVTAINAIQDAGGRRALVLVSDGADRYSRITPSEMITEARKHDVLVYPVALSTTPSPVLDELATVTGGRFVRVTDPRTLPVRLASIATELRRQYLIGYAPDSGNPRAAGWRTISVGVKRPGLHVRARQGYYAVP